MRKETWGLLGVLIVLVIVFLLSGCSPSSEEEKKLVADLQQRSEELTRKVVADRAEYMRLTQEIADLRADEAVLLAMKNGKKIHYIVKVSIRQVSWSLSVSKQLRDFVNEDEFEMPTDLDTYSRIKPGDNLFDKWRAGSIIFRGSLSSWRLKVVDKRVVTE